MKYINAILFFAQVAVVVIVIFGVAKGVCLLCAAVDPGLDAVLDWLAARALPIAVTVVVGFIVWIFGDVCDKQVREERRQ